MTRRKWYGVVVPLTAIMIPIVLIVFNASGRTWAVGGLIVAAVSIAGSLFRNSPEQ